MISLLMRWIRRLGGKQSPNKPQHTQFNTKASIQPIGAFFMARQPRTPGATTEAPKATETEVVTTTTADQADAALNAILGAPESKDAAPDAESTGTAYEPEILPMDKPIDEDPQAKIEYEEFLEWKKNRAGAATQPVAHHVPASGVGSEPVTKRTRQVLTDKGWDSKEY